MEEITKKIWEGQIPLVITFVGKQPLMLMANRNAYLTSLIPEVEKWFGTEGWFEFDGEPLKWYALCPYD
jgi:hypothetical protein